MEAKRGVGGAIAGGSSLGLRLGGERVGGDSRVTVLGGPEAK